jgi:DNA-binding CsgD family transcriptional regulator/PAS domain-containing protein
MSEDHELSCVLGSIYDAALDPTLWTGALAKIAEFVGGQAGTLGPQVLGPTRSQSDVGQVVSLLELMPDDDNDKGRCNQERARPQERGDIAGAVLERSAKNSKFLSVVRSEANGIADNKNDLIDHEMRRRIMLVAPHLRRAVRIGKAIDQKEKEAASLADVLDSLSAGLFLIEANGLVVHANAAGQGILDADDFLRSLGGRLVARDPEINRTLQDVFADMGDLAVGSKGIALLLTTQQGECHVAHLLPLAGGARRRAGAPRTAVAAVFVCRAALEIPSSADVIRRAYQLTAAELRVLLAIVNIGGIPEVATALGVSDSTIKTHVGHLFEKTGAGRQADLVKVVAGFSTPLVA